jgi:hypothetical protein
MAYILDARGTGGAVITLGETLTFPVASGRPELDTQPPVGSLRYNPDLTELELFRSDGLGGHDWRIVERISLDTSTIFQKTGGTLFGNMTITGDARMFLPSGSIAAPSLSFAGANQTGFSTDNDYVLHASVNGVDVAKFDLNLATINVPIQATTATFETINADTLNVTKLNTFIPREITGYFPGTYEPGQVIFRQVIAHRVSVKQNWDGSVAFLQVMPLELAGASYSIDKISNNVRTTIGNIQFATNSLFGTFWSPAGDFELDGGDIIEIVVTAPDVAEGLSFSLLTRVPLTTNVAPSNISISPNVIEERSHPGTVVGTLSVTDTDSTDFNYQLLDSADNRFALLGNQIVVGTTQLDWVSSASHFITVRAIDEDGLYYDKTLTISVRNIVDMAAYDPIRAVTSASTVSVVVKAALSLSIGLSTNDGSLQALASLSGNEQLQSISGTASGQTTATASGTTDVGDVLSATSAAEFVVAIGNESIVSFSADGTGFIHVESNADLYLEDFEEDVWVEAVVTTSVDENYLDFESDAEGVT